MFHFPLIQNQNQDNNNNNDNFQQQQAIQDPIVDLESLKIFNERNPQISGRFSFSVKFTNVQQRQVYRSLDYEDDADPLSLWGIRCVPLGHQARFYLLRNSLLNYTEFEYDYTIVSGDGLFESGYSRRGFVNQNTVVNEYLESPINISVRPQMNWFVININIRHLRHDRDYWFTQPGVPTLRHPLIGGDDDQQQILNQDEIQENAIVEAEMEEAAIETTQEKLRHLNEDVFEFPGFNKRLLTLFIDETLCDCEIKAGRAVFPAHKAILAAHSIVFRSMFCHYCTLEARTSTVKIDKFLPEAVLVMLQWFYTGELVPLDNDVAYRYLPLSDIISNKPDFTFHPLDFIDPNFAESLKPIKPQYLDTEVVTHVVQLANKYALDDLEYLAEQMLSQRVDETNCVKLLYLASLLQLTLLKFTTIRKIQENKDKILTSEEWEEFVEIDKEMADKVIEQISV